MVNVRQQGKVIIFRPEVLRLVAKLAASSWMQLESEFVDTSGDASPPFLFRQSDRTVTSHLLEHLMEIN